MSDDREKRMVFALAPIPADNSTLIILGIPRAAWVHIKDGSTNNFDFAAAGLPVKLLVFGGKDHADVKKTIEESAFKAGAPAVLDETRRDWSINDVRPKYRADGFPTRGDPDYQTPPEHAIAEAMRILAQAGATTKLTKLTQAANMLTEALGLVADYMEGDRE